MILLYLNINIDNSKRFSEKIPDLEDLSPLTKNLTQKGIVNNNNQNKAYDKKDAEAKDNYDSNQLNTDSNNELDKLIQKRSNQGDEKLGLMNNHLFKGSINNRERQYDKNDTDDQRGSNATDTPLFNIKPEDTGMNALNLDKDDKQINEETITGTSSFNQLIHKNTFDGRYHVQGGNSNNEAYSIKHPKIGANFAETISSHPEAMKNFVDQFVQHLQTHPNNDFLGTQVLGGNNNNSLRLKPEDVDKAKKIEDLKDKIETLEKDKVQMSKKFQDKEKMYMERISKLESILQASDKWDIFSLEKQNKEYEVKVLNLSRQVLYLQEEVNKEKQKNNSFIGELMILKQQLVDEISEIKNFKMNTFKKNIGNHLLDNIVEKNNHDISLSSNNNNINHQFKKELNEHNKIYQDHEDMLNNNFNSAAVLNTHIISKNRISTKPRPNKSTGKLNKFVYIFINFNRRNNDNQSWKVQ